ncbi:hypothetical protein J6590_010407 [Homalodisca vitripennis]|nr:hypothetical protein J6590_010407 [Homalodisca vitripennis]
MPLVTRMDCDAVLMARKGKHPVMVMEFLSRSRQEFLKSSDGGVGGMVEAELSGTVTEMCAPRRAIPTVTVQVIYYQRQHNSWYCELLYRCAASAAAVAKLPASHKMGCFGSKDKLSKEDMDFLKSHTRYDEATIKEWYKGFKVG